VKKKGSGEKNCKDQGDRQLPVEEKIVSGLRRQKLKEKPGGEKPSEKNFTPNPKKTKEG